MGTEKPKTVEIPDDYQTSEADPPLLVSWGGDEDQRDVTEPLGYDEHRQPLYAPRGFIHELQP